MSSLQVMDYFKKSLNGTCVYQGKHEEGTEYCGAWFKCPYIEEKQTHSCKVIPMAETYSRMFDRHLWG
jgi:hypothetical protein